MDRRNIVTGGALLGAAGIAALASTPAAAQAPAAGDGSVLDRIIREHLMDGRVVTEYVIAVQPLAG